MRRPFLLLAGIACSAGWGAEADLAGLWKNTAVGIGQSAIIVSQEGATIHVAGYGVWAGAGPGVWHSKGAKIEGARVTIPITYTKLPSPTLIRRWNWSWKFLPMPKPFPGPGRTGWDAKVR